ncbi:hypothetical protein [Limosilactobacillus gastricus]|uniref:hypothetical protein n=1 Tax=Limosilactobacillus gastricus TaxID=227942 RepID=UPI0002E6D66B|nr:hypothetical protein [Limosilactobacillus gastricus]
MSELRMGDFSSRTIIIDGIELNGVRSIKVERYGNKLKARIELICDQIDSELNLVTNGNGRKENDYES